jgi:UDP-glucose 4-epimerase
MGLKSEGYEMWGADLVDHHPTAYGYFHIDRSLPEFEQIFKHQHFNYCINAAGSGSVPISIAEPIKDFELNVLDTFKLLNAIRLNNRDCKYIHFSSAAVYGNPIKLPIAETAALVPVSPYGYHKWLSEIICKEFVDLYQMPIIIVRPFSAYGPGLRKQLIWDLYQKVIKGDTVMLHGTGNETRDFIYVDDIVKAVNTLMGGGTFNGDVYNIASGSSISIREVSEVFKKLMAGNKEILFENKPDPGTPLFWKADISKITALGFKPDTTFENGLQQTIQWIKVNG